MKLQYVPELYYAQNDGYRSDAAAELTDNYQPAGSCSSQSSYTNALKRNTYPDVVITTSDEADAFMRLSLNYLWPTTYPNGLTVQSGDFLDAANETYQCDAQRMHSSSTYKDFVYGRYVQEPSGDAMLQYWFFYYYNPKQFSIFGIGEHEGDWEMVQYHLDSGGTPVAATYSQHQGGETCPWANVPQASGKPVVYVGEGSHANYFWAGDHPIS